MMPFYGGYGGPPMTGAGQQQMQDWWRPGSGNPYLSGGYGGPQQIGQGGTQMYATGGMYGGRTPQMQPQQGGGASYGYRSGPPQQAEAPTQPDYTGMNSQFGQQYGQFLGQMYQPPQQINQSSMPIANRPMTYRPIQQQLPSFGSYSRY